MVMNSTAYPAVRLVGGGKNIVSHAGAGLLVQVAQGCGLEAGLRGALASFTGEYDQHVTAKLVLDLAVAVADGGDCAADVAVVRGQGGPLGPVASDPVVCRRMARLAAGAPAALAGIDRAMLEARRRAWAAAGEHSPAHNISAANPLIIDLDATLITAHSEKEDAKGTFKKGYGHHPLAAICDHSRRRKNRGGRRARDGQGRRDWDRSEGTGEPLAVLLRPGNAGSNTASDHIEVTTKALAQLPFCREGAEVLIRTDGAGGTHDYVKHLVKHKLGYSLGFSLTKSIRDLFATLPKEAFEPALATDGGARDGAKLVEMTHLVDLSGWGDPQMRLIVRAERPHPGAQLHFTDQNGWRLTGFITNTPGGQLQNLELRHRRRARCEDRIRNAKETGLRNIPFKGTTQNEIWIAIVIIAMNLTAWMQMIGLAGTDARTWEPKRLRQRLFHVAARRSTHARTVQLAIDENAKWGYLILRAHNRIRLAFTPPKLAAPAP